MRNHPRATALLGLISMIVVLGACSIEKQGGTMVLAEDGAWGYNGPHAVVSQGKLFYSYLDTEGKVWVASLDHASGIRDSTVVWETAADLHQASPLVVRPDGRIQVFVNKGSVYTDAAIFWKVSTRPGDISEFGELQQSTLSVENRQGRQFYPLVHQESGTMYLVINAQGQGHRYVALWTSPDGGDTWSEYHNLFSLSGDLQGNRCYPRAYLQGDHIHIATLRLGWSEPLAGHEIGRVEGVYYTKYNLKERAFYSADGSRTFDIDQAPVYGHTYLDEIWHWETDGQGTRRAPWSDIVADEQGTPFVAFAVQQAVPRGQSATHDGYWATPDEHGVWRHHKVTRLARGWDNTPERKNYGIALDPEDPHTVFVAKSTDVDADLSQVHRMSTTDHGASWQSVQVLSEEGRVTTVVVPRRTDATPGVVDALWLDGVLEQWTRYDSRIMGSPAL